MQEEDYEMLRNEANASPERFANWDPHRQFREEYHQRHLHDQTPDERLRNIEAHERGERTVSERSPSVTLNPPAISSTVQSPSALGSAACWTPSPVAVRKVRSFA